MNYSNIVAQQIQNTISNVISVKTMKIFYILFCSNSLKCGVFFTLTGHHHSD